MTSRDASNSKIAVIIPCHNEELTIGEVIRDFRQHLPNAEIYVCDNDSNDSTAKVAADAGAIVYRESRRGKGFAVRSMFIDIAADFYLLVDGDSTYSASDSVALLEPLINGSVDMTVGDRLSKSTNHGNFRPLHVFGNELVARSVNFSFGSDLRDIMSGYRGLTNRLVKTLPLVSRGFEIETQMTVQALYFGFRILEIPVGYKDRPLGSDSKLQTFRDGAKVLLTILNALKAYRPLAFFSAAACIPFLFGLLIINSECDTNQLTSKLYSICFFLISWTTVLAGLILDVLNHRVRELSQNLALGNQFGFAQRQQPGITNRS